MQCSEALMELLRRYSPLLEIYSVDECFLDVTGSLGKRPPVDLDLEISRRVREELGFTVNIGISYNKLLAKMASELEKPNKVHTIFPVKFLKSYGPCRSRNYSWLEEGLGQSFTGLISLPLDN